MRSVSRREVMSGIALGVVAVSGAGGKAMASVDGGVVQGGVAPGKHPIVPLPFDPAKLKGLSDGCSAPITRTTTAAR